MIVRRVAPLSAAKVAGTLYALLGFVAGVIITLFAMGGAGLGAGTPFAALFGVGAIILLPIIYGCFGFVFMAIAAALYNLAAKWVGGLNLEVE